MHQHIYYMNKNIKNTHFGCVLFSILLSTFITNTVLLNTVKIANHWYLCLSANFVCFLSFIFMGGCCYVPSSWLDSWVLYE